jgi:hypothetical protein
MHHLVAIAFQVASQARLDDCILYVSWNYSLYSIMKCLFVSILLIASLQSFAQNNWVSLKMTWQVLSQVSWPSLVSPQYCLCTNWTSCHPRDNSPLQPPFVTMITSSQAPSQTSPVWLIWVSFTHVCCHPLPALLPHTCALTLAEVRFDINRMTGPIPSFFSQMSKLSMCGSLLCPHQPVLVQYGCSHAGFFVSPTAILRLYDNLFTGTFECPSFIETCLVSCNNVTDPACGTLWAQLSCLESWQELACIYHRNHYFTLPLDKTRMSN